MGVLIPEDSPGTESERAGFGAGSAAQGRCDCGTLALYSRVAHPEYHGHYSDPAGCHSLLIHRLV